MIKCVEVLASECAQLCVSAVVCAIVSVCVQQSMLTLASSAVP